MWSVIAALIVISFSAGLSFAQKGPIKINFSGKPEIENAEFFDPKAGTTVVGKIISEKEIVNKNGKSYVVGMTVKSDVDGKISSIHFIPGWCFECNGIKVKPGDRVEIKGKAFVRNGILAVIPAEVKWTQAASDELLASPLH